MATSNTINILLTARDEASAVIKGVSGAVSSAGERIEAAGRTATVALAALGAGALAFTKTGFSFNSSVEQAQATIQAFTKDAGKTAQILEDVRVESLKTQFSFKDMATAAAGLIPAAKTSGVALNDLIKEAEILAALNPEEGLKGAAFALKEALSGDFVSIVERFRLPRQRLNELKADGVPAIDAIRTSLKEMGIDYGVVAAQGQTTAAQWDTIKDQFTQLAGQLSKPLFDKVSSSIKTLNASWDNGKIVDKIEEWKDVAQANIGLIAGVALGIGVPAFLALAGAIWSALAPLLPFIAAGAALGALLQVLADRMGGWASLWQNVTGAVSSLWGVLDQLFMPSLRALGATITNELWPALQRLWTALGPEVQASLKYLALGIGAVLVGAIWALINVINIAVNVITWFIDVGSKIATPFLAASSAIRDSFLSTFRLIASTYNATLGKLKFQIPAWVPGVGGNKFDVPAIPGFSSGGYTGAGSPNSVAGVVHQGEYVIPASEVDQTTGRPAMSGGITIEHMEVNNNVDVGLVTRELGFMLATR